MLLFIICGAVAVAAICAYFAMTLVPGAEHNAVEDRLKTLVMNGANEADNRDNGTRSLLVGSQFNDTKNWLEQSLGSMPGLSAYIEQADVKLAPVQFIAICAGCFVAGIVIALFLPISPVFAPIIGFFLGVIPLGWLMFKRKRRLDAFGKQIPDALELLSRSLRSGHSLGSGFSLVSSELPNPISGEFRRVFEEQNLGVPVEEALTAFATRVPNMDIRFFATAVILQRTTGGDLAEILDKIGRLVRERLQIHGQVQALTGEGRLSGIVLLALPPILFFVMLYLNKDYVLTLFTDPLGKKMLAFAVVMQILGALAIKKIITIKV